MFWLHHFKLRFLFIPGDLDYVPYTTRKLLERDNQSKTFHVLLNMLPVDKIPSMIGY